MREAFLPIFRSFQFEASSSPNLLEWARGKNSLGNVWTPIILLGRPVLENSLVNESVEPVGSRFFIWSKSSAGRKSGLCTDAHEANRFNVLSVDLLAQPGAVSSLEFLFV